MPYDEINLTTRASIDVPVVIHSSLTKEPGSHVLTLKAAWDWLEKTKAVNVRITRNPLFEEVSGLGEELEGLEGLIGEYSDSGIYVGDLERAADEIRQALYEANASIPEDRLNVLEDRISRAVSGNPAEHQNFAFAT